MGLLRGDPISSSAANGVFFLFLDLDLDLDFSKFEGESIFIDFLIKGFDFGEIYGAETASFLLLRLSRKTLGSESACSLIYSFHLPHSSGIGAGSMISISTSSS